MPELKCDGCDYTTENVREGMTHAADTDHTLSGPGVLEDITITISVGEPEADFEDDDPWDWED